MRRGIRAAVALVAGLAISYSPIWAKGDGIKENKVETDSGMEASASFAFEDVDDSSSMDWGAASGGPEFDFELWSLSRARMPGMPWLATGPVFEVDGRIEAAVATVSGEVFLAADGMELRGLVGWGGDASFTAGTGEIKAGATILGGIGVFDLSDADSAYLPSGADAESFWFRVQPCIGADASFTYKVAKLELRAQDRYLATWEAETASGIDWDMGFEERLELKAIYALRDAGAFSFKGRAGADFSLESRVIAPVLKYSVSIRGDLEWKGVGALELSPAIWTYKAKVPDLSDFGTRDAVERQLSGKVEWESEIKDGSWSMALRFPWIADEDGSSVSGEWELGASVKLDL